MQRANSLSKLSLPARFGVAFLLVTLTGLVYFVVFHSDIQTSLDSETSRHGQLEATLEETRAAEHNYQKDLAELADRQQRQRELSKILPATTESAAFLSAVQNVANVAGVNLKAWTPQAEVPQKFYAKVPMKLELSGRYHQIAKFFYNVGQLERIINMEDISILEPQEHRQEPSEELLVQVQVLATAFHLLENEGQPDPARRQRNIDPAATTEEL